MPLPDNYAESQAEARADARLEGRYLVGDIVRCRPRWPNQPAFGIWTSDTVLTTEGRIARVSDACDWGSGKWRYTVQFDRLEDGTFNDAHWGVSEDEIVGLWDWPEHDCDPEDLRHARDEQDPEPA